MESCMNRQDSFSQRISLEKQMHEFRVEHSQHNSQMELGDKFIKIFTIAQTMSEKRETSDSPKLDTHRNLTDCCTN